MQLAQKLAPIRISVLQLERLGRSEPKLGLGVLGDGNQTLDYKT